MEQNTAGTASDTTPQCVLDALSRLPGRERQLLLFLGDKLKQGQEDAGASIRVQAAELEFLLEAATLEEPGQYFEQIEALLAGIGSRKITLSKSFSGTALPSPRGHLYWLSGIDPHYNEHGIYCIQFFLSPFLAAILRELSGAYCSEDWQEMSRLSNQTAIRLFQLCLSFFQSHKQDILPVRLDSLKEQLGLAGKHGDFRNFRQKVLEPAREEVNARTSLNIAFDYVRDGRQISDVRIFIHRKSPGDSSGLPFKVARKTGAAPRPPAAASNNARRPIEVEENSEQPAALERAFAILASRGVSAEIILQKIFPSIKGSEVLGHEDVFVMFMLDYFEKKIAPRSKEDEPASLRRWLSGRPLDKPSLFARFMEQLVARKKRLLAAQ